MSDRIYFRAGDDDIPLETYIKLINDDTFIVEDFKCDALIRGETFRIKGNNLYMGKDERFTYEKNISDTRKLFLILSGGAKFSVVVPSEVVRDIQVLQDKIENNCKEIKILHEEILKKKIKCFS